MTIFRVTLTDGTTIDTKSLEATKLGDIRIGVEHSLGYDLYCPTIIKGIEIIWID